MNQPHRTGVDGPVLFARYAYPPNALGLCGPGDPEGLRQSMAEGTDPDHLAHLATQFDGAWPYLELIAGANGIDDPLDRRVVRAYWLGNDLLGRVPMGALATSLEDRFARRAGRGFESVVAAALSGAVAQHSFHVFAVYPWLGLLRAGVQGPPLQVLDQCRIRWGRVEALDDGVALVTSSPLEFVGSRLTLATERLEKVHYQADAAGFARALRPGDVVSMHWDWICERLSCEELASVRACTRRNLAAVNDLARPGPAMLLHS